MGFLQFVQALWRIQYVRVPTPLTKELYDQFFDITQGITDVCCKLFMLAQARIIASGADTDPDRAGSEQALITPQLLRDVYQEAFGLLHPALSVLRTYREERAKATREQDTAALEKARLALLKLGDVILPEEYVNTRLQTAEHFLTTMGNLRTIKEAAISSTEVDKVLLEKLGRTGIDSILALRSVLRVREDHPQEQDISTLLALASDVAQGLVEKAASSNRQIKERAKPTTRQHLRLREAVLQGERAGMSPSEALTSAGRTLDLGTLREGLR